MKQYLDELEKYINDEIVLYRDLEALYKEKEEILVNRKVDELFVIDSKIVNKGKSLAPIVNKRKQVFDMAFGGETSMSRLISECEKEDSAQAKRFSEMKKEVNTLVESLKQLEYVNNELTKFGIKITNKTMQIILNNINIPTNDYNNQGKLSNQEIQNLSSISEEV